MVDAGAPRDAAVDTRDAAMTVLDAAMLPDAAAPDAATALPDGGNTTANNYGMDGPRTVTTQQLQVQNGTRSFNVRVFIPSGSGAAPVVSISPGLQQRATAYNPYGQRLASWGFVVVIRDDPGALTETTVVTGDIAHVLNTWLPAQHVDNTSPLFGRVDVTRLGLAGHSRGGKASLIAAATQASPATRAWFGLDPVDSSVLSGGIQARDLVDTLTIPKVYLGASVSSSCSLAGDNHDVLFDVSAAPALNITVTGAGHTDFQDRGDCVGCNLCTPAGTADSATVLTMGVRLMTGFFAREFLGDNAVGATLDGAGAAVDETAGRITRASR
jgi:hypothetical protein